MRPLEGRNSFADNILCRPLSSQPSFHHLSFTLAHIYQRSAQAFPRNAHISIDKVVVSRSVRLQTRPRPHTNQQSPVFASETPSHHSLLREFCLQTQRCLQSSPLRSFSTSTRRRNALTLEDEQEAFFSSTEVLTHTRSVPARTTRSGSPTFVQTAAEGEWLQVSAEEEYTLEQEASEPIMTPKSTRRYGKSIFSANSSEASNGKTSDYKRRIRAVNVLSNTNHTLRHAIRNYSDK